VLRILCENPWEGGGGYSPREVAEWTLDQCWFRMCDRNILKLAGRTMAVDPKAVKASDSGEIAGRAADGTPIKGRIAGKSVARQLMERKREREAAEQAKIKARMRRRSRRKRKGC